MKHIRFLGSQATICDKPFALGSDVVTIDIGERDEPSCRECSALLMTHNMREFEREREITLLQTIPDVESKNYDYLIPRFFLVSYIMMMIAVIILSWLVFNG